MLEIGAGSGIHPQNTHYPLGRVDGTDLDPKVTQNPNLVRSWICDFYDLSEIRPHRFDMIYSHMVAEHVDDPISFIQEQLMLLAPGGVIVHSTLSKWSPPAIANRILPRRVAKAVLKGLRSKRESDQVFPAKYRMNSKGTLGQLGLTLDLSIQAIFVSQPIGYFKFSRKLLGLASILMVPLEKAFPQLRSQLVVVIRRGGV